MIDFNKYFIERIENKINIENKKGNIIYDNNLLYLFYTKSQSGLDLDFLIDFIFEICKLNKDLQNKIEKIYTTMTIPVHLDKSEKEE